jgi:hypothetical protein
MCIVGVLLSTLLLKYFLHTLRTREGRAKDEVYFGMNMIPDEDYMNYSRDQVISVGSILQVAQVGLTGPFPKEELQ